jgi:cold shock protein
MPPKELKAVVAAAAAVAPAQPLEPQSGATSGPAQQYTGTIHTLKDGFGFIRPETGGGTIFFFHAEVTNVDFSELHEGERVRYRHGKNDKGTCAVEVEVLNKEL